MARTLEEKARDAERSAEETLDLADNTEDPTTHAIYVARGQAWATLALSYRTAVQSEWVEWIQRNGVGVG